MKVTVLSSLPPQRGVTPYTMHLLAALASRSDIDVDALGFHALYPRWLYPGGTPETADEGAEIPVPANRCLAWYNPLTWIRAGLAVRGDVIHAQWWSWFLAPAYVVVLALARLRGKRVIVTVHNTDPHEGGRLQRLANRLVLPVAHRLIVHSERNRRPLADKTPRGQQIDVVPMGVAAPKTGARSSRPGARAALGLATDAPLVLFFGNIRPYKGVDDLIEAFRSVRLQVPEARLAIVGQPWRGMASVPEAIERAGIGEATIARLDYVDARELRLFLDAADVVVFPYRAFDAQSAAAADAVAAGRAIIVTDVGGLPDLVRDPRAIVPVRDCDALAAALVGVLRDHIWRRRLESDAEIVSAELSWDAIASATMTVYERALGAAVTARTAPVRQPGGDAEAA